MRWSVIRRMGLGLSAAQNLQMAELLRLKEPMPLSEMTDRLVVSLNGCDKLDFFDHL